jgi:uncharacterized protein
MTVAAAPDVTVGRQTVPVGASERIQALDILRGFALFGMILVHFHQKMRVDVGGVEDLIPWGVWILAEQKAWGTFALLFGAGFAILLRRLAARGANVVPIYLRRLATLALFGVIADVGFGFRILFEYACWGLVLLAVRRWPTRALLGMAALAASARPIASLLLPRAADAHVTALYAAVDAAAAQGSYTALLGARWALFAGTFTDSWRHVVPDSNLALFIVGLLAVRTGVFDDPLRHVRLIVGWMTFGFVSWALAWIAPVGDGLGIIEDQWLCFTYVGGVVLLLAYRPEWTSRLAIVGFAGRMALTNYMVQAIVLDALSSGYGAHLKLRPYAYVTAAMLLFSAVALASRAWLGRFSFGPLEHVWRTATYATIHP